MVSFIDFISIFQKTFRPKLCLICSLYFPMLQVTYTVSLGYPCGKLNIKTTAAYVYAHKQLRVCFCAFFSPTSFNL